MRQGAAVLHVPRRHLATSYTTVLRQGLARHGWPGDQIHGADSANGHVYVGGSRV